MFRKNKRIRTSIAALFVGAIFVFMISCDEEKKEVVNMPFNVNTVPRVATDSVTAFVSDSGYVRYKLVAKIWQTFDSQDPHWFFPKGIYVEQYDTLMHIAVTLKADTAWNYTNRQVWKLKGHVFVKNTIGETFEGEELYWTAREHRFYSDKKISIKNFKTLRVIEAEGFEADESMSKWTMRQGHDGVVLVPEDSTATNRP